MNRTIIYAGAAVAFTVGLVVATVIRAPKVSVAVHVQQPISGVRVAVDGDFQGVTDDVGQLNFSVRASENSQLTLSFAADRYDTVTTTVTVWGDSLRVPTVHLQPMQIDILISVSARHTSGEPLAGAAVLVNGEGRGFTDTTGLWEGMVAAPYGTSGRISVVGVPQEQAFEVVDTSLQFAFVKPAGVPVTISTRNQVAGIEVIRSGEVLGKTGDDGTANVTLPVGSVGVRLSFRLLGTTIADWVVPDTKLASTQQVEHTIDVHPVGDIQIDVSASMADDPQRPAVGYEVHINGDRVATTGADGRARTSLPGSSVLIGGRIGVIVQKGTEGVGRGRVVVEAEKGDYPVAVRIAILKIVRIRFVDEGGRPVPKVLVKMDGDVFARSAADGWAQGSVKKLDVEYRFTFEKDGYTISELVLRPTTTPTEREVRCESLSFLATFVDSLTGSPIDDLEIWFQGARLFTTIGETEPVSIPRLGAHVFTLKSDDPRYPKSQDKTITVSAAGQDVRVKVASNPVTFKFRFQRPNGRGIPNREVRVRGVGYLDQKRTDDNGEATFSSYQIQQDDDYDVELNVGTVTHSYKVRATGYMINDTLDVSRKGELTIRAIEGAAVKLELYPDMRSLKLKRGLIKAGSGTLVVQDLEFRDYALRAVGEATLEVVVTVDGPQVEFIIDTQDPYEKGRNLLAAGDTLGALEQFRDVRSDHNRYSDAQKELCFHHNQKGEFVDAERHCGNAMADSQHRADPYLYLSCAQASHRVEKYDQGIECAQKAFTYWQMFAKAEKRQRRDQTLYLEALCFHDQYFRGDPSGRDCQERKADIQKLLYKWESFQNDAAPENKADVDDRIAQVQGEFLNLPCD
jgi:hypothetical protein